MKIHHEVHEEHEVFFVFVFVFLFLFLSFPRRRE